MSGLQVTVTGFQVGSHLFCSYWKLTCSSAVFAELDSKLELTQGFHRLAVIKLLERMGATVQKDMVLSTITHIIAKDMDDRAQKLRVARR